MSRNMCVYRLTSVSINPSLALETPNKSQSHPSRPTIRIYEPQIINRNLFFLSFSFISQITRVSVKTRTPATIHWTNTITRWKRWNWPTAHPSVWTMASSRRTHLPPSTNACWNRSADNRFTCTMSPAVASISPITVGTLKLRRNYRPDRRYHVHHRRSAPKIWKSSSSSAIGIT